MAGRRRDDDVASSDVLQQAVEGTAHDQLHTHR